MTQVINFLDRTLILGLLLLIPGLWVRGARVTALSAALAGLASWMLALIIKMMFYTPRPYLAEGVSALISHPPIDGAFPSAHAATAFAISMSIFLVNRRLGIVSLMVALLVGIMRVWVRVHYPLDIFGGAVLGTAVALLVFYSKKKC